MPKTRLWMSIRTTSAQKSRKRTNTYNSTTLTGTILSNKCTKSTNHSKIKMKNLRQRNKSWRHKLKRLNEGWRKVSKHIKTSWTWLEMIKRVRMKMNTFKLMRSTKTININLLYQLMSKTNSYEYLNVINKFLSVWISK